jgi:hypothetical protein
MQMYGCEWWNPNSRYSMELAQRSLKSGSPPSSFVDPQGLGGTIFLPCSPRIERWNGGSSRQLSGDTTYQPGLWTGSSMSFWHSLRATEQCCSMPRLLMTCASMRDIMQIQMRRSETGSGGGSALSSVNTVRANSYNELVNMAISQEDCITARQAEKKRKTPVAGPSAQPQRFRIVSDT